MTPNSTLQPTGTRLHSGAAGRAGSRQQLNGGVRQHSHDTSVRSEPTMATVLPAVDPSAALDLSGRRLCRGRQALAGY